MPFSAKSKSVVGRILMYGLAGGTATVGGVVTYANKDPNFKQAIDQYVPGFRSFVDTSGEVYHRGAVFVKMGWDLVKPIVTPERGNTGIQPPEYTPPSTPASEGSKDITTSTDPAIVGKEQVVADSKEEIVKENENSVDKEVMVDPTYVPATVEVTKDEVEVIVIKAPDPSQESAPLQPVSDPVSKPHPQAPSDPSQEPSPKLTPDPVLSEDHELEAKKISVENELRSLYQDFILKSDNVLASIDGLVQSMGTHYRKIREVTDNPPDNETDIQTVSGTLVYIIIVHV